MMRDQFGSLPYVPVPPVVQFGQDQPSIEQLIAAANRSKLRGLAVRGSHFVEDQYLEPGSHPLRIRHPAFLQDDPIPIRRGPPIGPAGGVTPPSPGMLRSTLGNVLGALDKAQTVFASDPSGMTPYPGPDWLQTLLTYDVAQHLPWERRSVPGISYTDDQKERLEEIKILRDSGQISDWKAAEEARKVHEELPWWGEIARETVSPLGIVSMVMGGPAVTGTKALLKQGTAQTRRIPGVGPGLATGLETAGRVPAAIVKTPFTAVKMTGIARHFKKPATAAQITEAQKAVGGIQKTGNVTHVASIDTMINQIQPGAGVVPQALTAGAKLYHGTRSPYINQFVNENGDLVIKASENFQGKTIGISFSQSEETAMDYASRIPGQGPTRSTAQATIFEIDANAIPNKLYAESAEEIATRGRADVLIPKGKFRIIQDASAKGRLERWEQVQKERVKNLSNKDLGKEWMNSSLLDEQAEGGRLFEDVLAGMGRPAPGLASDIAAKYGSSSPESFDVWEEMVRRVAQSNDQDKTIRELISNMPSNPIISPEYVARELRKDVAAAPIGQAGTSVRQLSEDIPIKYLEPSVPTTTGTSFIARETKRILDKYNVSPEWRRRLFFINPYAVADMQHPVEKIRVLLSRGVDDAEAHIGQLMNRINASGDIDRLFKLDKYGMVHAPNIINTVWAKGKPISKNKVFAHPERYGLTPEQMAPLNEWYELADDAWRMLQKEGIEVPSKIRIGRFFPGHWKWLRDSKGKFQKRPKDELPSRLRPFGIQRKNPLYDRVFENLDQAESLGYRSGASAREDMTTYFRFVYQSILEERVGKIIRTYSKTLSQRTIDDLTGQIGKARTRRRGLSVLYGRFQSIADAQGWLMPDTNWYGRDILGREAPELLRELVDPKWLNATNQERQKMLQTVKARIKTMQQEAAHEENLLKNTQNTYKQHAGKKLMETTMPIPRLRGQIFTPEEFATRYSPTIDLDDAKFLTMDEIKTLTNLFEPHQNALLQSMTNVNLAIRTSMAGFDFGAGQIHGALMMSTMPAQWAKVQAVSMRALFDPNVISRKMKEHQPTVDILNNTGNLDAVQSDFIGALRPGGLIHKFASSLEAPLGVDIPVWTKTVGKAPRLTVEAFERQFSGFITYGKVMTFEALKDTAIREGGENALIDLSQHVSKMFGTLSTRNLGTVPIFEQFLSAIPLFAPRYRMATWGLMMDAFRGGMKGELARDALGKLALVGIMTHYAIAKGLGQEPKLDPSKGDFLTVQVGDIRVGWGTAYRSSVRMILATSRQMAEEGFVEGVRVDKYDNKLGRAIRYSTSPVVGTAWDTITGRSALGDPIDTIGDFIGKVPDWTLPFWLSGMMDNPRPGWHYVPLTAFGANAHAISDWDRYKQNVEITIEKEWDDIGKVELSLALRKYPELRELKEQAENYWADRGVVDEWTGWSNDSDIAKNRYNQSIDNAMAEIASSPIDNAGQGGRFRKAVSTASAVLAEDYNIRANKYPELVKMMNEMSGDDTAPILDQAKDEYMRTVVLGNFDILDKDGEPTGDFNYEGYRKAKNAFTEKWGPEFMTKIQESLVGDKRNPSVLQIMRQDLDDIKVYWEVGEAIIKASGNTHLLTETEGKGMSIWSQYISERSYPDLRQKWEVDYPSLKQIYKAQTQARIILRERGDGQLEQKLIRWDFVKTPRNRINMQKSMSELRRIPLN